MFPFFTILGREIPTFGLMGIIGVAIATYLASFRAKRYNLERTDVVYIAAFAGVGLLLGSMIMFTLTRIPMLWRMRELVSTDLWRWLRMGFGGMVFYGGLFGAIIALWLYAKRMKIPFGNLILLTVPVFPLAHAFMRVGCFLGGCCYGIFHETLGVVFPRLGAPHLPVQLYESFANLIIFAVIWTFTIKERHWITVVSFYGLMYSVVRFVLEYFRGDVARGAALWFSTSQWISIAVFAVCIYGLIYKNKRADL